MSASYIVGINSGQSVSAAFALERADLGLVIEVPSLSAGSEVRPQFSATSGGAFWTMQRPDGSGSPYAVHSGVGPAIGVIERLPSPWGRVLLTTSVTAPTTFTLYSVRRT